MSSRLDLHCIAGGSSTKYIYNVNNELTEPAQYSVAMMPVVPAGRGQFVPPTVVLPTAVVRTAVCRQTVKFKSIVRSLQVTGGTCAGHEPSLVNLLDINSSEYFSANLYDHFIRQGYRPCSTLSQPRELLEISSLDNASAPAEKQLGVGPSNTAQARAALSEQDTVSLLLSKKFCFISNCMDETHLTHLTDALLRSAQLLKLLTDSLIRSLVALVDYPLLKVQSGPLVSGGPVLGSTRRSSGVNSSIGRMDLNSVHRKTEDNRLASRNNEGDNYPENRPPHQKTRLLEIKNTKCKKAPVSGPHSTSSHCSPPCASPAPARHQHSRMSPSQGYSLACGRRKSSTTRSQHGLPGIPSSLLLSLLLLVICFVDDSYAQRSWFSNENTDNNNNNLYNNFNTNHNNQQYDNYPPSTKELQYRDDDAGTLRDNGLVPLRHNLVSTENQGPSLGASTQTLRHALTYKPSVNKNDIYYNEPECGVRKLSSSHISKRIIGGDEANFAELPWQAHIRIAGYQCGGVLVNRYYVATAAHCVHKARLRDITIHLGEFDTKDTGRYYEPFPKESFGVVEKRTHPNFKYMLTQPDRFDVAVLRLSRPANYQPNIVPICLPPPGDHFNGAVGIVAGWGKTDNSYGKTGTNILRKVTVPIIDNHECLRWHHLKNIDVKLHYEMFCAGHSQGKMDACLGDSGGPLVVNNKGRWTLAGITSAGFGCAVDHQPGIYHKVAITSGWIAANVRP